MSTSILKTRVVQNVNCAHGIIKNYRRAINHLKAYLEHTKNYAFLLKDLDMRFASEFKAFLVNANPSIGRAGMTEVSAATVIKKFRTIFSNPVDHKLIQRNPFKNVKIKTKSPRKERLSMDQVQTIYSVDLRLYQYLEIYRDLFLFCVYTGLAYKDLIDLSWNNLELRSNGEYKIVVRREKTDVITESFLPKQAITLIDKYRNLDRVSSDKIFPYRSNKEINSQLKLLAQITGIGFRLTVHTAKHTFRQLLAEAGIFDMGIIKRMMGQSRSGEVDDIYYMVTDKALLKAKRDFQELLDEALVKPESSQEITRLANTELV